MVFDKKKKIHVQIITIFLVYRQIKFPIIDFIDGTEILEQIFL